MADVDIHQLILKTYDAVAQTDKWQSVLDLYSDAFGLMGCNIFCYDNMEFDANASFFSTEVAKVIPKYIDDGIAELEHGLGKSVLEIQELYEFTPQARNIDYVLKKGINTEEEIERILSWVKKYGMHDRGTILLNKYDNYHDWITLQFKQSSQYLSAEAEQIMNLLNPHIAKVMYLNRPFYLLQQRFNAVFSVLDRFKLGVVIINPDRSIVLQNNSAERVQEQADCYSITTDKKMRFMDKTVFQSLKTIISSFTSNSCLPNKSVYHSIKKKNQDAHYFIEISRLDGTEFGDKSLFLAVIMDTSHKEIVNMSGLVSLYQLSEAEEAVAELLVEGRTNHEIADLRNVSIETVRSQVKSILQKTNTSKRSDLIRLAHSISLPVDKAENIYPPQGG